MPDDNTQQQQTGGVPQTTGGATPGQTTPPSVVVPDETKQKFPDLVELILKSQSMNDQERNYWLQVLPVMTEDQVKELRDILETEKRKLEEIDKKYAAPAAPKEITAEDMAKFEEEKRKQAEERKRAEEAARAQENPDDLLAALNDL